MRFIYDTATLTLAIIGGTLVRLKAIVRKGKEFLAYFGGTGLDDTSQYVAPGVGAALKSQFTPKGIWIAKKTYRSLDRVAGEEAKKKFVAAMEKGIVGPKNEQGIKILITPHLGYITN